MSESFDTPPTADEVAQAGFDTPPTPEESAAVAPAALLPAPPSLTAYRAARSGVQPEQAAQALALAPKTGLSPQFVADNLQEVQDADQQRMLTAVLGSLPVTSEYAGQSAVHAAAVKDDVHPLGQLEAALAPPKPEAGFLESLSLGLQDIGYGEAATVQMSHPTQTGEEILQGYEERAAEYDQKHAGIAADLARSAPTLALYALTGKLGGALGGKVGEVGATAGMMFALNRGVLYRRIWQEASTPTTDEELAYMADPDGFDRRARVFATAGAGASSLLGAGLASAVSLAAPGAARKLQQVSTGIIARAFTDAATRDIIGRMADTGVHTLAGALMMAVPAVIDDATVQKATTGEVDAGRALEAGWDAFKKNLLAAAVMAAIPHAKPLVQDMGRIHQTPAEAARIDLMVEQAQASKVVRRSPQEAEKLLGKMAEGGDATTVYIDSEALQRDQKATQAVVEALADEGQAVAQAQATGGDVAVPVEKYLVRMGDQHDALREDVKLDPEGLTPRQAEELRRELDGWQQHATVDQNAQTLETKPLPELAAEKYGGTPEQWAQIWTPETVKKLGAALNPQPAPVEVPPKADSIAWAKRLADEGTIAELQPGRYELAARRSEDKLAQIAKASAEKGQEAARQGFLGAGAQEIGSEQTPKAGAQNLREAGKKADKAAKLLADVPMLERARDLARAQAQVHADIRTEMDKARKYLADRDTERFRGDLAKADPAYLGAFDALLDVVKNMPRAPADTRLTPLDTLLERMDRDAEPVGFDPEALRATLTANKGWPRLTPPEARNVLDAVKNIRSAARNQNQITLGDQKATLREFVDGVKEWAKTHNYPDSGLPAPSRVSGKEETRTDRAVAEGRQAKEILRRLGPGGEAIYDGFVKARNYDDELSRTVGMDFHKAYEVDMPKEIKRRRFDGVKGPGSPTTKDNLWTRQDLWTFASLWGSETGQDRIRRGYQISDAQAHEFLSQLTNAEADFIEAKWKLNDEKLWPLIRDHASEADGIAPPKVEAKPYTIRTAEGDIRELPGGYEPIRYAGTVKADVLPTGANISDYWGSVAEVGPATPRYFLNERETTVARRPDLNWSTFSSHVTAVLRYVAYDKWVSNFARILRDDDFQDVVRRTHGESALDELRKFATVAARGRVDDAMNGARNLNSIIGSGFRSRAAYAAFAGNPVVAVGQLGHLVAAKFGLGIPTRNILEGFTRALNPFGYAEAHAQSEQLPYRWNNFSTKLRSMLANVGPGETEPLSKLVTAITSPLDASTQARAREAALALRGKVDAFTAIPHHLADGFVSRAIWEAARTQALDAGADAVESAKAGDTAVSRMMPPMNPAEQSSWARDRGALGSLLLVTSYPNVLWNVQAMRHWNANNQIWAADPGLARAVATVGARTKEVAGYLAMMWGGHVMTRLLMGQGRQPDESTKEWLERSALSAPFYSTPILSDAAEVLAESAVGHKSIVQTLLRGHSGFRQAPLVAVLQGAIRDFGTVVDGPTDVDRAFAAAKLAMTALKLPPYYLRPGRYAVDLMSGEAQPRGPFDVAGGFFYGKRRRQPKNPATLAQDFLSGD